MRFFFSRVTHISRRNDHDTSVIDDTRIKEIVEKARVARLATVDSECKPHLIPVVFVFDNNCYFIPIDEKIKDPKLKS
jgi:nitroimidazol reductase NimA-like FMN-containing flavoprotein (pyridoxamine 5'-phosphate oxidase superfamily)